jgi:hypothetical protein
MRLETMVAMTGLNIPTRVPAALHQLGHPRHHPGGPAVPTAAAKLVSLQEITGMEGEAMGMITMQEIFSFIG